MKSNKILLPGMIVLFLLVNLVFATRGPAAQSMPVPTGQEVFPPYNFISTPISGTDPSMVMPVAVGPLATDGDTLSLQVSLDQFSGPVDIYFGIFAPAIDPNNVYILTADGALQPASSGLIRWKSDTPDNISESLFGNIPVSALPSGRYYFFLLVTPPGTQDKYYFWTTEGDVGIKTGPPSNVMPITVNGSLCSADSYPNKPCVSVTVCTPGTTNCQTISDILLDTGSYGLRVFKQALTVPLVQTTIGSASLAECVQFGDGSSDWGPVQVGSLTLGNEPPVVVPIHVIDSTFGTTRPSECRNADGGPSDAGFNGVLGLGPFPEDCGSTCVTHASNGLYYACSGSVCAPTAVALSAQVQNPVVLFPKDNNGVIVQLPAIPLGGVPSVDGSLIFGVGTQSNNNPSPATAYPADDLGDIITEFNGTHYSGFLDTGSNALFFTPQPAKGLPRCPSPDQEWFCPASTVTLSASNEGAMGLPFGTVAFQIGNFDALLYGTLHNVFAEIGGIMSDGFDWGLPFFFGRSVIVGFEGRASSLGTGPYLAY